jgi:protein TonB
LVLNLSPLPPAAPSIAALADPAPMVVDEAPDPAKAAETPEADAPAVPDQDMVPDLPKLAAAPTLPAPEVPVAADLTLPPPPTKPEPQPADQPDTKPRPNPKLADTAPKSAVTPDPRPDKTPAPDQNPVTAGAIAPDAGAIASGGAKVSAAAYARSVMKAVRATPRKSGGGRGMVIVGFSIARDGSLDRVMILAPSGNAALDAVAIDHIRRAAPFPAPPDGVGTSFSFEFVGK